MMELNKHTKSVHVSCSLCPYVCRAPPAMAAHIEAVHKKCPDCQFIAKDQEVGQLHTPFWQFVHICIVAFQGLEEHNSSVHMKSSLGIKCPGCDFITQDVLALNEHMKRAHKVWCSS